MGWETIGWEQNNTRVKKKEEVRDDVMQSETGHGFQLQDISMSKETTAFYAVSVSSGIILLS